MKVLITGGAGFIGSYLCDALFSLGYEVIILDNLSPQIHPNWEGSFLYNKVEGKCKFIKGDIRNRQDIEAAIKDVNAIVHLAADTGTGQSMYEINRYYEVNVQGTALLLDTLVNNQHSVKKVVVASSRAVYGEGKYKNSKSKEIYPDSRTIDQLSAGMFDLVDNETQEKLALVPTDEESKLHPSSIYGLTKLAQEQMIMLFGKQKNIPAVALRFQNVYGPGQSLANPYTGLLAVFSNRIRNGNPLDIYEDGKTSRDFVYIDDVVNSIILALKNDSAKDQIFNVGSGVSTSISEVAKLMVSYFNVDVPINTSGRFRVGDIRHNIADLSKSKSILGYEPTIPFEIGLKRFVEWVLEQEVVEDRYERSIEEIKAKGLMN